MTLFYSFFQKRQHLSTQYFQGSFLLSLSSNCVSLVSICGHCVFCPTKSYIDPLTQKISWYQCCFKLHTSPFKKYQQYRLLILITFLTTLSSRATKRTALLKPLMNKPEWSVCVHRTAFFSSCCDSSERSLTTSRNFASSLATLTCFGV